MGRSVTLVRHHPTVGSPRGIVSAAEWSTWLGNEDERGIEPMPIPASLLHAIGASQLVLVSPYRRARETWELIATELDGSREVQVLPDLVEAPLPALRWARVRLPASVWDVGSRVLWLAGWSREVESSREVSARVARVVRLIEDDPAGRDVTVIAHGWLNLVLSRALRRAGWRGPRLPDSRNGGATTYRRLGQA